MKWHSTNSSERPKQGQFCICLGKNDNNSYFVECGSYYNFGADEFWSFGDDWYSTFGFKKVEGWVDLEELVKDFERSVTDIK